MNTVSPRELEIFQRNLHPNYQPGEIAVPRLSSTPAPHIRRLKILGLLAALAIFLASVTRPLKAASQTYRAQKAPDFTMRANNGQTYTPYYLKGNVVLLYFWATWCPYCRRAVPHMNALANEYANSSFAIIGICGSKDTESWHNYIEEHRMYWPQYFDKDLKMAHLFGAKDVPNFFLIDKNGYVVYHQMGWGNSMPGELERMINRALDEPDRQ